MATDHRQQSRRVIHGQRSMDVTPCAIARGIRKGKKCDGVKSREYHGRESQFKQFTTQSPGVLRELQNGGNRSESLLFTSYLPADAPGQRPLN
jgi:hypothetical protein